MKIVILDAYAANPGDLSWDEFAALGELTVYDRTAQEDAAARIGDAEVVFINKVRLTDEIFAACPNLKLVSILATGYNIVDLAAAKRRGITVCNVPGYSTRAVVQMTFALLLEICQQVGLHSGAVHTGRWQTCPDFCFWDRPLIELDGKTIDVVWNGMTLTDEVTSSMACSNAYCNNAQVVILPADKAADYDTVDSLSGLRFAVESGSAGMAQAEEKGLMYTDVVDQATALLEVKSGTADAAIIDSLMAGAMVGEGTNYADLAIGPVLNAETGEQYGVGFRKGSDAVAALNEFFRQQWESGALQALAEQYGVQAALIEQK